MSEQDALLLISKGNVFEDAGRFTDALRCYEEVVRLVPSLARGHLNRGNALLALGDAKEAAGAYETALMHDANYAAAHYNLGNAYTHSNRREDALVSYGRALALKPDFADAEVALGALYEDLGRQEEAAASYRRALQISPDYAAAHSNLGNVLRNLGQLDSAIATYRRALELDPHSYMARSGLSSVGNALKESGRLDEAIDCYRQLLKITPDSAEAHSNLGNIFVEQARPDEAAACYRIALELKPDFAEAHHNLGCILKGKSLWNEAAACFNKAIELKPEFPEPYFYLGNTLLDQDRVREAKICYVNALKLRPEYADVRWALLACQLPAVSETEAEQAFNRAAFSEELEKLNDWFDAARKARHSNAVRIQTPFYLAYQEQNNRELLRRHGNLCARIMAEWLAQQMLPRPDRGLDEAPIRVGIVSHHIRNHSVWHAIVKGWLRKVDRERFALQVFYIGLEQDQETLFARSRASHFEQGEWGLAQWVNAISSQQPDILLYPEIGMETMAGKLASMRLAPVQAATWGHPETTGLPTIDYYLSAEYFEPENAQDNYTERLVTLPSLGCFCEPYEIVAPQPDLGKLGIDPRSPILLCSGVPYKYAPQHDWLFVEIARRLGRCQLVFFTFPASPNMSEKLRKRLEIMFDENGMSLNEFVVFIPWQDWSSYFGLLKRADVFLDTIGFSGFNTAMKALECGLPVVTREGRFLRGRLASGILKRMDMQELVAQSDEDYVALVARLVQDRHYFEHISDRIEASRHILFEDEAPIRALEEFFVRATSEVRTRNGLPNGLA